MVYFKTNAATELKTCKGVHFYFVLRVVNTYDTGISVQMILERESALITALTLLLKHKYSQLKYRHGVWVVNTETKFAPHRTCADNHRQETKVIANMAHEQLHIAWQMQPHWNNDFQNVASSKYVRTSRAVTLS